LFGLPLDSIKRIDKILPTEREDRPTSRYHLSSYPKEFPMEKRLGVVAILIQGRESIPRINQILSAQNEIILGRLGMPFRDRGIQVISLVVEGSTDQIGALTGPLGRLAGVQVKSILTGYREGTDEQGDHVS